MKKSIAILIIVALFYSCNEESNEPVIPEKPKPEVVEPEPEPVEPGNENDTSWVFIHHAPQPEMVLVDSAFNDRLNPKSPGYWGDEYVKGIKVFSLYKGRRITPYEAHQITGLSWYEPGIFDTPVRSYEKPWRDKDGTIHMVRQNTLGYYYISCITAWEEPFRYETYIYICYPNGSEDEIKILLYVTKDEYKISYNDKIWVNGELAYAMSENEKLFLSGELPDSVDIMNPDNFQNYYNPKYYPWLENFRDHVRPVNATDIVVIMK